MLGGGACQRTEDEREGRACEGLPGPSRATPVPDTSVQRKTNARKSTLTHGGRVKGWAGSTTGEPLTARGHPGGAAGGVPTPPPRTPETQSHHEDLPRDTQPHPLSVKDMKTRPRNRRGRGRLRRNSGCTQAHGRDPGQNWDPWGTVRPRAVCGPGSVNTPAAANLPPSREVLRGGSTGLCRLPPACKWRQPDLPGRENGSRAGSFSDRAKFAC